MLAFALDQTATGTLVGLIDAKDGPIAALARTIVDEERVHQAEVLTQFAAAASVDPSHARQLAQEMIAARDWIRALFPRHGTLQQLADAGLVRPNAANQHDTFLASLGDRIQEALGVLGD